MMVMKKYLLLIGFGFLVGSVFSQSNSFAVDDTINIQMGDIITFNPLLNDYNTAGEEFEIVYCSSSSINILSFTDSTITFKVPDYFLDEYPFITYRIDSLPWPSTWGRIRLNRSFQIDTLQCNQIKATIYPQNLQFRSSYFYRKTLGYFYPADAKTSPVFNYGLWMGGKDQNGNLHLAAERYRNNGADFWSGPLSVDGLALSDSINAGKWFRTWKVRKTEVLEHINNYQNPNYQIPEAIETWPAHGDIRQAEFLAPFVDVDLDEEYHPENGDYPLIKGDESIFFIYNDHLEHGETDGLPLGVEIHCMAWGYNESSETDELNNTVFFNYKFFNRSMQTYNDTYIGVYTDFDLGFAYDDYVRCDVSNGNYYVYNADDYDEDNLSNDPNGEDIWGYHDNIPTQGTCILAGPFMDSDNMDNPLGECDEGVNGAGFGDGIIDNERYGMTGFTYYSNWPTYMKSPQYAHEYYNYMQSIWSDESPLVYGGLAHPTTEGDSLFPARFMWPGDSDPCNWGTGGLEPSWDSLWTEETTGNMPSDRRAVAGIGPFTFEAGSIHYLDIALVTAPGDQEKNSKDLLQEYIAQIKQDYLLNPEEFGNQYLSIPEETKTTQQLFVYPNPADGDFIRFELNSKQEAEYFIYSAAGQVIENGSLAAQKEHSLNIGYLKSGWY
ncbi:MAG: T9SS type A sorting domain-containing protein, partial [Bacteroidales bacterium]|nr:T9SS type A sorting domain-containing protein [Bacteroidales bacterium]